MHWKSPTIRPSFEGLHGENMSSSVKGIATTAEPRSWARASLSPWLWDAESQKFIQEVLLPKFVLCKSWFGSKICHKFSQFQSFSFGLDVKILCFKKQLCSEKAVIEIRAIVIKPL